MAKKRNPKHARGINAWLDAAKRAARAAVPATRVVIRRAAMSNEVHEAVHAVLGQFVQ
ncbi:hypothetical protein ACWF94_11540 [Streptomyces sp. NPDC055078]